MKQRRNIVKNFGLSAVWISPVVKAIAIPAHAQTTQEINEDPVVVETTTTTTTTVAPCPAIPAGCYEYRVPGVPNRFLRWNGGTGPELTFFSFSCNTTLITATNTVIASSVAQAQALLPCTTPQTAMELDLVTPLPGGCTFYQCSP